MKSVDKKCRVKVSWQNSPEEKIQYLTHTGHGSLADVMAEAKEKAQKSAGKKLQITVEEAVYL